MDSTAGGDRRGDRRDDRRGCERTDASDGEPLRRLLAPADSASVDKYRPPAIPDQAVRCDRCEAAAVACTGVAAKDTTAPANSSSSSNSIYIRQNKRVRIRNMGDGGDESQRVRHQNWDGAMDRLLMDLMIEEMLKKNYANGSLKQHSWTVISKAFNTQLGHNCTSNQLKERFKNLKRKFALYEELLRLSGWGWDPDNHTPIPGYEGAWDEVIKVNHRFSLIKRKSFPVYDQMQILCKNCIATGDLAEGIPPKSKKQKSTDNSPYTTNTHINEFRNAIPTVIPVVDDDDFTADFALGSSQPMSVSMRGENTARSAGEKTGTSALKRKGKEKVADKNSRASALETFADLTRERNGLLKDIVAIDREKSSAQARGNDIPSIQDILRELKSMPDLPYTVFLKSMNLFIDPNLRVLFAAMAEDDKVNWLTMMTSQY